jgi:DNA-binding XRE family transcriptional regulator
MDTADVSVFFKLSKNESYIWPTVSQEESYEKGKFAEPMLTAAQCRAARGLLDWTQADLSAAAGLSAVSVRAFEKGGPIRESNARRVRLALEKAGVEFIPENGGGAGVRLKHKA